MVIDLLTTVFQHAVQSIKLRSYFIVLPHSYQILQSPYIIMMMMMMMMMMMAMIHKHMYLSYNGFHVFYSADKLYDLLSQLHLKKTPVFTNARMQIVGKK